MIASPIEHRHVALATTTLHVALAGPADGVPVLLVHGFPETWWSWRHQIDALVDAGYRVIAPDLRGYGASTREGPFDLATLAGDMAALIAALGHARAHVVGHDWGGATAWQLAAHHPERVSRLVVIDCPLPERLEQQLARVPRWAQVRRSWYIYVFQLPWLGEWLIGRHDAGNVIAAIRGSSVRREHMSAAELEPFRAAARPFASPFGRLAMLSDPSGAVFSIMCPDQK